MGWGGGCYVFIADSGLAEGAGGVAAGGGGALGAPRGDPADAHRTPADRALRVTLVPVSFQLNSQICGALLIYVK